MTIEDAIRAAARAMFRQVPPKDGPFTAYLEDDLVKVYDRFGYFRGAMAPSTWEAIQAIRNPARGSSPNA
jgi:hypothetical protein